MEISSNLAQNIINSIQDTLGMELNFINTDGIIIASTDTSRIGTFHQGAKIVVKTKEELVVDCNDRWIGTHKGINIPIFFLNEVIGVIGLTGEKEAVVHYGKILQKLTEILVKEAYLKDLQYQQMESNKIQVNRIINYDERFNIHSTISNFNTHKKQFVIYGTFDQNINNDRIIIAHNFITKNKNTIFNLFTIEKENIILFANTNTTPNIENELKQIQNILSIQVHWGIGTLGKEVYQLKISYQNALYASQWAKKIKPYTIQYYHSLGHGLFITKTGPSIAKEFIYTIFKNLKKQEIAEFLQILTVYENYNGSITKASQSLFMHKNTFQYKLNKIYKQTGYDPRKLTDFSILKIACLFYQYNSK